MVKSSNLKAMIALGKKYKKIFDKARDKKKSWKDPQLAIASTKLQADQIGKAFEWFHGSKAKIYQREVPVRPHKTALTYMLKKVWVVESPGYY